MPTPVYVYPVPSALRGMMTDRPRLYAYPTIPEPPATPLTILDSGAYALSLQGRTMDAAYIAALATHYTTYRNDHTICIAPDVFLDWQQSVRHWQAWHKKDYPPVVPVIQFTNLRRIDLMAVRKQCLVYGKHETMALSNPGLRGIEARTCGMCDAISLVRSLTGAAYIHVLGAGWDVDDIRAWASFDIQSFDSIAWYTSAQSGTCWSGTAQAPWTETARINATAAYHATRRPL